MQTALYPAGECRAGDGAGAAAETAQGRENEAAKERSVPRSGPYAGTQATTGKELSLQTSLCVPIHTYPFSS